MITFLAVFGDIQSGELDFFGRTESHGELIAKPRTVVPMIARAMVITMALSCSTSSGWRRCR